MNIPGITIEQIQAVFFASCNDGGWSSKQEGGSSKSRKMDPNELPPGHKGIEWKDGPWVVRDVWTQVPENPYSGGHTTIEYESIPLWLMQYHGWYAEDVITFVQNALGRTYRHNFFFGGRGPDLYREGNLVYINEVGKNDFTEFDCKEKVINIATLDLRGYHNCSGLLLFPYFPKR